MAYYGDDLYGDCLYLLVSTGSNFNDKPSVCSRLVMQLILVFCRNLTVPHVLIFTVAIGRLVLEQLCMCGKSTMRLGVRCVRAPSAQISIPVSLVSLLAIAPADPTSYPV